MTGSSDSDRELVAAALKGVPGAAAALKRATADLVWTACVRVTGDSADAEQAFKEVMSGLSAGGFARLKAYDGRSRVRVFLALVVRDLLSERVVKLLALDLGRGWRAFEALFADDMKRMILRMLPGNGHQQNREDAYQSICEALLKNDLQRLRAYSGRGSPSGFILHVVENLVIDHVRTIVPRRRLPAAIQRLPALGQAIFRLIHWRRLGADPAILLGHLSGAGEAPPNLAAVAEAIAQVRAALPLGYRADTPGPGQTVDLSAADDVALAGGAEGFAVATPEDRLIDGQAARLLEQALAALQQAALTFDAGERLYLQLALTGQPARDIARLLGLPVENIHKIAQRVKRRLRDEIGETDAVKNWRLSV